MKQLTTLLLLLFVLSMSNVFAQEAKKDIDKTTKNNLPAFGAVKQPNAPQATGDKVLIKDGTTTLLEITNEGSTGSILMPNVGVITPSPNANKLYNNNGSLYWNGLQLATGTSSPWSVNGSNIYYNTGNVGIGTDSPQNKLHVLGDFRLDDASPYLNFYSGLTPMGIIGFWTDNNLNIINKGATGNIVLATNSTEKVRITANGNVGIGNANPLSKLSVNSEGEATVTIASENSIVQGTAIIGVSHATPSTGVTGMTDGGNYSAGVSGSAIAIDDVLTYGGHFGAEGNQSRGVYGEAISTSGTNYGVYGKTNSTSGYGGYFEGRGYFSNRLGIGILQPEEMLHVNGNMRLTGTFEDKDGQAGTSGQILSSTSIGTDWINPTSGADNLGNHTATQNIRLSNNWLSGDGGNEGVYVSSSGNVGVGTATPVAGLHVEHNDGVLFTRINNSGTIPASGTGIRMMWYAKKAAFRAGIVNGTQWDDESIGTYSVAFGSNTKADGTSSTAMGGSTTASGQYSTAMGGSTTASGQYSTAMGLSTTASGDYSTAMGRGIRASGIYSVAIALDDKSGTSVTQDNTMAIMGGNVGIGTTSPRTALNVSSDDGVLFQGTYGSGTALNLGSGTRMMWYAKNAAFRAGYVDGTQWDDVNIGDFSTAMGSNSTASGSYSTAMGSNSTASGGYSTAMGYRTTASGNYSTAIGYEIEASGDYSFAIALNDQNGTNVTQSSTMAIMGGKVGIGTANPYSKLAVGGNGLSTATIYGYNNATSGNVSGGRFEAASNEARAVYGLATSTSGTTFGGAFNASNSPNGTGVWASGGQYDFWAHSGTYGNSSSIRWKRNIVEIDNPLRKVAEIRGVYFDWDEEHGNKHSVGFIAEEVGKVLPEIVFYEENGIDAKGMDYTKITPLLVEAVKALVAENDKLKQRLEALENKLNK